MKNVIVILNNLKNFTRENIWFYFLIQKFQLIVMFHYKNYV